MKYGIVFALLAGATLALAGPQKVVGSGKSKSETRSVSAFHGVRAGVSFDLTISVGPKTGVTVSADDNVLRLIRTEVKNGVLVIDLKENISLETKTPLRVAITNPQLDMVDLRGAAKAKVRGINAGEARLRTSGASELEVDGQSGLLDVDCSGASKVSWSAFRAKRVRVSVSGAAQARLGGTAGAALVKASGAAHVTGLRTESSQVETSGAASVDLDVSKSLLARASGSSNISYSGSATNVKTSKSGSSSVSRKG